MEMRKIKRALISVYHKEPARKLIESLNSQGCELYSTGGTHTWIQELGIPVKAIDEITSYPSILGGRVKTLHPSVFGGILARRGLKSDQEQVEQHQIPLFDMVVVDLYPFEETLASGGSHDDMIEKIDIGGISLIRAAAKNYFDVTVVPSAEYFDHVSALLQSGHGEITLAERKKLAAAAFDVSSYYDTAIFHYLQGEEQQVFKYDVRPSMLLRYGENPHQQGSFFGQLDRNFEQLNGKSLSYNNLLDIDAAIALMADFSDPCFAIIKHTNVCGIAVRDDLAGAWKAALEGDPVSAFGGIIITNRPVTKDVAISISDLFYEVLLAPSFKEDSLDILRQKKNRIILKTKHIPGSDAGFRSVLNGILWQTADRGSVAKEQWHHATRVVPSELEATDLFFANIVVKHLKSNAISLVRNKQLLGIGAGQTSRVDALKQAIAKARAFGHDLNGAVMASDAFFPFPDCVEIAYEAGITSVIQPGGSVKDQESIDYCDKTGMSMVFTGRRHFKH